ncbi:hypothetical protein TRFO_33165 [Tritrichomonas foetus]|uniref:Ubiquitin-conjugating enzyme family protein n=1 Tax=Tritrichomonas foetus TaxID=1144522 RepID=A0A1J4JSJ0_9EUKA|nr:hypothetical protein TRFO_33165 [Tritrichomonas foetus]|eukprot:OHT00213.1 hypothetical protein TRFO_33165 [Tritrichomonas foetus]
MSGKLKSKIKVTYYVNPESSRIIIIPKSSTVADFIGIVRGKHPDMELNYVFLNGALLDAETYIEDLIDDDPAFVLTKDDYIPFDIDIPDLTYTDTASIAKPILLPKYPDVPEPDRIDAPPPKIPAAPAADRAKPKRPAAPSKTVSNRFRVFTTASISSFLDGKIIEIDPKSDVNVVKNAIKAHVGEFGTGLPANFEVFVYLPTGIPYLAGTIDEWDRATGMCEKILYAVVTRPIPDALLNGKVTEICNCSNANSRLLLSPLYDATEAGYTQIASLLGYFFYNGHQAEHLLQNLAKVTGFAPLINSLFLLLEKESIYGRDVITITSALHRYMAHISKDAPIERVFDLTLAVAGYIDMYDISEILDLKIYEWDDGDSDDSFVQYLKQKRHPKHTVLWEKDLMGVKFNRMGIPVPNDSDELHRMLKNSPFRPLRPLTLHYVYSPSFVKAGGPANINVGLFIREIFGRERMVDYIDPLIGHKVEIDYNELAKRINNKKVDTDVRRITGQSKLPQIIYVCVDASTSMRNKICGKRCKRGEENLSRMEITKRLIECMMKRIYDFRVTSVRGLIVFGENVEIKCPLSPVESDFNAALRKMEAYGKTFLWDAMNRAADEIIRLKANPDGDYAEARARIIVISDGDDTDSSTITKHRLAQKLVENRIVADAIMMTNTKEDLYENRNLKAVTGISGGVTIQIDDFEQGVEILETESFLNIAIRSNVIPIEGNITEDRFEQLCDDIKLIDVKELRSRNKDLNEANRVGDLSTPEHIARVKNINQLKSFRERRIVKELNHIAHNPDPTIVVFAFKAFVEKWRVFIQGPAGTPYQNYWWHLLVTFPINFPNSPPNFRFINVPYHQNVSPEGKLIFTMLEQNYQPTMRVNNILKAIQNLLLNPDDTMPIMKKYQEERTTSPANFRRSAELNARVQGIADYMEALGGVPINQRDDDDGDLPADDDLITQMQMTMNGPEGRVLDEDIIYD